MQVTAANQPLMENAHTHTHTHTYTPGDWFTLCWVFSGYPTNQKVLSQLNGVLRVTDIEERASCIFTCERCTHEQTHTHNSFTEIHYQRYLATLPLHQDAEREGETRARAGS